METVVVVGVLSITLLLLFASYSYILRRSRTRNTFDTTETIYKTYYVKQIIDSYKNSNIRETGVKQFIDTHPNFCHQMQGYNSYECDLTNANNDLIQIRNAFEVEKLYYLNPHELKNPTLNKSWMLAFDATTIDYLSSLGEDIDNNLLIVKYKKKYNKADGTYEVFHSSIEVNSWWRKMLVLQWSK